MRKISKARSSRRAPPLKDSDYDHEINLVDHVAEAPPPQAIAPEAGLEPQPQTPEQTGHPLSTSTTANSDRLTKYTTATENASQRGLASPVTDHPASSVSRPSVKSASTSLRSKISERTSIKSSVRQGSRDSMAVPEVQVEEPTPLTGPRARYPIYNGARRKKPSPESAIDVLYENQRGCFLCGIPLFSPKALGQLDPPAWTNVAHKPSPTNINTAQVPDPSWEWAWPEWRINKDVGVDSEGWEYSFMFTKAFSWHSATWYNSFVRRRAWIRKRVKKNENSNDPHMLNTEYFTIRPTSDANRPSSRASSHHSKATMSAGSSRTSVIDGEKPDIEDIETLMAVLSRSRIDREKIEAVENFLQHGEDELAHLQHKMHDIMAIFVFQASRRVLLTRLNEIFEETQRALKEQDTGRLQRRCDHLKAAILHADEECRRLEYWSDVKKLVKEGETGTATDKCKGWDDSWQGVDSSGPSEPRTRRCNL